MDKRWDTLNCIIYQILKGSSNVFLVCWRNKYILIDTGRKTSWNKLNRNIDRIVGENHLSCLILTHTHFDHAENTAIIKNNYKTKIIVHESEAEYLKQGNSPLPKGTNRVTGFLVDIFGKRQQSRFKYEPVTPDIMANEIHDLNLSGSNSYIIHTPGHTKGSISVIIDNEIALVGDAMFGVFKGSVFPPFGDDQDILIESWGKLLQTGCLIFLPGHGKEISREFLQKQGDKYQKI